MVSLVCCATLRALARRLRHFTPLRRAFRAELGAGVSIEGRVWLPGTGRVRIGDHVRLVGLRAPIELRAHEGAEIVIEEEVVVEDGVSIEATAMIRVGAGARLGSFSKIIDNHFHHTTGDHSGRPDSRPVTIGRGAVVGPRAVILPGAEVGDGAIVGAGAVLSFRIPGGVGFPGPVDARTAAGGFAA
jgi:acetyltransferase-like isoleucine patch superfamily enzyme